MTSHQVTTSVKLTAVGFYLVRLHVKDCSLCCFLIICWCTRYLPSSIGSSIGFHCSLLTSGVETYQQIIPKQEKKKQNDVFAASGQHSNQSTSQTTCCSCGISWYVLDCAKCLQKRQSVNQHFINSTGSTVNHWGFLTRLTGGINARCALIMHLLFKCGRCYFSNLSRAELVNSWTVLTPRWLLGVSTLLPEGQYACMHLEAITHSVLSPKFSERCLLRQLPPLSFLSVN